MSVKAVYTSKTLGIYITGPDVDELLRGNIVLGPLIAAGETLTPEGVDVRLTVPAIQVLRIIQNAEASGQVDMREETYEEFVQRIAAELFG